LRTKAVSLDVALTILTHLSPKNGYASDAPQTPTTRQQRRHKCFCIMCLRSTRPSTTRLYRLLPTTKQCRLWSLELCYLSSAEKMEFVVFFHSITSSFFLLSAALLVCCTVLQAEPHGPLTPVFKPLWVQDYCLEKALNPMATANQIWISLISRSLIHLPFPPSEP
jgi:hypothetical protein